MKHASRNSLYAMADALEMPLSLEIDGAINCNASHVVQLADLALKVSLTAVSQAVGDDGVYVLFRSIGNLALGVSVSPLHLGVTVSILDLAKMTAGAPEKLLETSKVETVQGAEDLVRDAMVCQFNRKGTQAWTAVN